MYNYPFYEFNRVTWHFHLTLQEEISSPLSAQLLEYYNSELFQENMRNPPQVGSCPNSNCYEENSNPMTDSNLFQKEGYILTTTNNNNGSSNSNNNNGSDGNFSAIFDVQEEIDDISASIDFSTTSPFYVPDPFANTQQDKFDDFSSVQQRQQQLPLNDVAVIDGLPLYSHSDITGSLLGHSLPSIVEDCISSAPCTAFLAPNNVTFIPAGNMNVAFCGDAPGIFSANMLMGRDLVQPQELDYRCDSTGFYYPDSKPQIFNPGDVQVKGFQ